MPRSRHPIDGQVFLMAGAKASVTLPALSALLGRAQRALRQRRETYEQRYERVGGPDARSYFLAETNHWEQVGETLDLGERETDALRRVHAAQFRRAGRRLERLEEFEATLEIRDVVVFGPGDREPDGSRSEDSGSNDSTPHQDTTPDQDTGSGEEKGGETEKQNGNEKGDETEKQNWNEKGGETEKQNWNEKGDETKKQIGNEKGDEKEEQNGNEKGDETEKAADSGVTDPRSARSSR